MPLTKLANTALDRAIPEKSKIAAEIREFAGSDMVCYRAESPAGLVQRQQTHWNPIIAWAKEDLGAGFETVSTITHRHQSPDALQALMLQQCGIVLVAVHNLTTLTGSALLHHAAAGDFRRAAWLAATWRGLANSTGRGCEPGPKATVRILASVNSLPRTRPS